MHQRNTKFPGIGKWVTITTTHYGHLTLKIGAQNSRQPKRRHHREVNTSAGTSGVSRYSPEEKQGKGLQADGIACTMLT